MDGSDYKRMTGLGYFDVNAPMGNYSYLNADDEPIYVDPSTGNSTSCFGNYLFGESSSECGASLDLDTSRFMYGSFGNYLYDGSKDDGFNYGKLKQITFSGVDIFMGTPRVLTNFIPPI